jgi:hypothetical protein
MKKEAVAWKAPAALAPARDSSAVRLQCVSSASPSSAVLGPHHAANVQTGPMLLAARLDLGPQRHPQVRPLRRVRHARVLAQE